jgi:CRISPR-associated protein Csx16
MRFFNLLPRHEQNFSCDEMRPDGASIACNGCCFGSHRKKISHIRIMTTFFVSRHQGALDWARRHGISFDRAIPHLSLDEIQSGDTVIGSLPVNLAAEVCAKGAAYHHLSLKLKLEDRGRELTADDLDACGATLTRYLIGRVE